MKTLYTLLMATAIAGVSTAALAEGTSGYPSQTGNDAATQQYEPSRMNTTQESGAEFGENAAQVPNAPSEAAGSEPAMQTQLSSNDIEDIQQSLSDRGYALQVDGVWGRNTAEAVRQFQASNGLPVTGTLTASTIHALEQNN